MKGMIGWDVGGVNIKAVRLIDGATPKALLRPFELQRAPARLPATLAAMAQELGVRVDDHHAVTMTAELSQYFRTKREGVEFVLQALEAAFGSDRLHVFGTDGRFSRPDQARLDPLRIAAANWLATAQLLAQTTGTCLLIDIGSTTADVIPIVSGAVVATGRTDPARLASGELVYTGALRTPAEAVTHHVPFRGDSAGVSAEGFAIMGDVHLWLGALTPEDYTVPTPDGRPPTRLHAGERLARVVCGDREMLSDADVDAVAGALAEAQTKQVAGAVSRVCGRHPEISVAVVTGLGDFIAREAARRAGLSPVGLAERLGHEAARVAPAFAVATLLGQMLASTRS
jgi:(4-(4-[2-(gamma-L-glutamylamino)ethyl]phenoxymethyl)furan-2-yl)methanamine synthase